VTLFRLKAPTEDEFRRFVAKQQDSGFSNLTPSEVQAWLECEAIHHSQAPDGTHLICLNSLLKRVQKPKTG
jgi:flavin reductase (DIM6/NTAB) family NADH-FMN oxidoreductase RutF